QPLSWISTFQRTFLDSLHSLGNDFASAWPSPLGPRNCGQLSSAAAGAIATPRIAKTVRMRMQGLRISRTEFIPFGPAHNLSGINSALLITDKNPFYDSVWTGFRIDLSGRLL